MVSIWSFCTPLFNKSVHNPWPTFKSSVTFAISWCVSPVLPVNVHPALMSPNSRKHKGRLANEIYDFINLHQLMDDDDAEVLSLALTKLNLDRLIFINKPTNAWRKMMPQEIQKNMTVLAYKQHDIYIDIKTSKIKSFLYKKWFKMNQTLLILFSLYNNKQKHFSQSVVYHGMKRGLMSPPFKSGTAPI